MKRTSSIRIKPVQYAEVVLNRLACVFYSVPNGLDCVKTELNRCDTRFRTNFEGEFFRLCFSALLSFYLFGDIFYSFLGNFFDHPEFLRTRDCTREEKMAAASRRGQAPFPSQRIVQMDVNFEDATAMQPSKPALKEKSLMHTSNKKIFIGPAFQASIEPVLAEGPEREDYEHRTRNPEILLWQPTDLVSEEKLKQIVETLKPRGFDEDQILAFLNYQLNQKNSPNTAIDATLHVRRWLIDWLDIGLASFCNCMVDWLIDWLIDWLVNWIFSDSNGHFDASRSNCKFNPFVLLFKRVFRVFYTGAWRNLCGKTRRHANAW